MAQFRSAGTVLCRGALLLTLYAAPAVAPAQDTAFYGGIERYATRHAFTRWLYGTVFVPPVHAEDPPAPSTPQRRTDPLLPYAGRVVRSVDVVVLDPFGFDLVDSAARPEAWIQRAGNTLHRRTREYLVREFVLVKKGETFDPLKAAESERLLRATPLVNDARVTVLPVGGGTDTVDVRVLVLDKWSIEAWADLSGSEGTTTLMDRNLLGLGQQLQLRTTSTTSDLVDRVQVQHSVYNIRGSYIGSQLSYAVNGDDRSVLARLERTFYSPLARWAGAAGWTRSWNRVLVGEGQGTELSTISPQAIDTWMGRSFLLQGGKASPVRSSAVVAGMRYTGTRYLERPPPDSTGAQAFPDVDQALVAVGLSVRQYYRERYLFRFGAVEDVPEGLLVKLTGGLRDREGTGRMPYAGIEIGRGRHYHGFGYASFSVAAGTFWHQGRSADAATQVELRYFTDLFHVGRFFLRQFVTVSGVSTMPRIAPLRLDLNGDQLFGFNSASVSGTHKELLRLETVAYAPWKVLGFRFAPVLLAGFGTIGGESSPLFSGRLHRALGLGLLIRNENLLVKTFEVTFNFYPYVPEENGWVFDVGRYGNYTTRLNDYSFTQPGTVAF